MYKSIMSPTSESSPSVQNYQLSPTSASVQIQNQSPQPSPTMSIHNYQGSPSITIHSHPHSPSSGSPQVHQSQLLSSVSIKNNKPSPSSSLSLQNYRSRKESVRLINEKIRDILCCFHCSLCTGGQSM